MDNIECPACRTPLSLTLGKFALAVAGSSEPAPKTDENTDGNVAAAVVVEPPVESAEKPRTKDSLAYSAAVNKLHDELADSLRQFLAEGGAWSEPRTSPEIYESFQNWFEAKNGHVWGSLSKNRVSKVLVEKLGATWFKSARGRLYTLPVELQAPAGPKAPSDAYREIYVGTAEPVPVPAPAADAVVLDPVAGNVVLAADGSFAGQAHDAPEITVPPFVDFPETTEPGSFVAVTAGGVSDAATGERLSSAPEPFPYVVGLSPAEVDLPFGALEMLFVSRLPAGLMSTGAPVELVTPAGGAPGVRGMVLASAPVLPNAVVDGGDLQSLVAEPEPDEEEAAAADAAPLPGPDGEPVDPDRLCNSCVLPFGHEGPCGEKWNPGDDAPVPLLELPGSDRLRKNREAAAAAGPLPHEHEPWCRGYSHAGPCRRGVLDGTEKPPARVTEEPVPGEEPPAAGMLVPDTAPAGSRLYSVELNDDQAGWSPGRLAELVRRRMDIAGYGDQVLWGETVLRRVGSKRYATAVMAPAGAEGAAAAAPADGPVFVPAYAEEGLAPAPGETVPEPAAATAVAAVGAVADVLGGEPLSDSAAAALAAYRAAAAHTAFPADVADPGDWG